MPFSVQKMNWRWYKHENTHVHVHAHICTYTDTDRLPIIIRLNHCNYKSLIEAIVNHFFFALLDSLFLLPLPLPLLCCRFQIDVSTPAFVDLLCCVHLSFAYRILNASYGFRFVGASPLRHFALITRKLFVVFEFVFLCKERSKLLKFSQLWKFTWAHPVAHMKLYDLMVKKCFTSNPISMAYWVCTIGMSITHSLF